MTNVHLKKKFVHVCDINRPTLSQSSSGEMSQSGETSIATDERCRYVQKEERTAEEGVGFMTIQVDLLLLGPDVSIREDDVIENIRFYSNGSVVDAGPFTVERVLGRNTKSPHHISVQLERVEQSRV